MDASAEKIRPAAWVRQSAVDKLLDDDTPGFEGVYTLLSAEKGKYCTVPLYLAATKASQPVPTPVVAAELCEDCPPEGYSTDITRCLPCTRRSALIPPSRAVEAVAWRWRTALCGMLNLFDEGGNFTSDFATMQAAVNAGYSALAASKATGGAS